MENKWLWIVLIILVVIFFFKSFLLGNQIFGIVLPETSPYLYHYTDLLKDPNCNVDSYLILNGFTGGKEAVIKTPKSTFKIISAASLYGSCSAPDYYADVYKDGTKIDAVLALDNYNDASVCLSLWNNVKKSKGYGDDGQIYSGSLPGDKGGINVNFAISKTQGDWQVSCPSYYVIHEYKIKIPDNSIIFKNITYSSNSGANILITNSYSQLQSKITLEYSTQTPLGEYKINESKESSLNQGDNIIQFNKTFTGNSQIKITPKIEIFIPTTGFSNVNGFVIFQDSIPQKDISYHSRIKIGEFVGETFIINPTCNTQADTNCDGKVDRTELGTYIVKWINNQATRTDLANAIQVWIQG